MSDRRSRTWFIASIAAAVGLTALIANLSPLLQRFPHLPDKGASWYFWQLPEATLGGRLSAWLLYGAHQVLLWYSLWRLSRERRVKGAAATGFGTANIRILVVNFIFVLLHILQTHIWYDGLAKDVPVWSSQGSVIVMLVIMLYMAAPIRGLFAGRFKKMGTGGIAWVRSWHGYFIAWALCYTFWFHPTEGDYGLLTGFFYMFLLFIHLGFAYTPLHMDLKWVALLELFVGLHGPAIAIQKAVSGNERDVQGPGIWIMFFSGFFFMFAFTGQYGFSLKKWQRALVYLLYFSAVAGLYAWRGFGRIYEIAFIPTALYGGALGLFLVGRLAGWILRKKPEPTGS